MPVLEFPTEVEQNLVYETEQNVETNVSTNLLHNFSWSAVDRATELVRARSRSFVSVAHAWPRPPARLGLLLM